MEREPVHFQHNLLDFQTRIIQSFEYKYKYK